MQETGVKKNTYLHFFLILKHKKEIKLYLHLKYR